MKIDKNIFIYNNLILNINEIASASCENNVVTVIYKGNNTPVQLKMESLDECIFLLSEITVRLKADKIYYNNMEE